MSFWLDAVLTRQYLINRLPTSTLPENVTPFEIITNGRKPDLSHLRIWGCKCFVAVPNELRGKAGPKHTRSASRSGPDPVLGPSGLEPRTGPVPESFRNQGPQIRTVKNCKKPVL